MFYLNFKGVAVSSNYEMAVYDDLKFTQDTIKNVAFWDYTGKGDFNMVAAVMQPGALTLQVLEMDI